MSERKPPTNSLVTRARREAKRAVTPEFTHSQALDQQAVLAGYQDWRALTLANQQRNSAPPADIPLDPVLPPDFDYTSNDRRSKRELDTWWEKPFAISHGDQFEVRCLDGGAWDRSTYYGMASTMTEANELARTKLAQWQRIMQRPTACMREDGLVDLMVINQRPGRAPKIVKAGIKPEDAEAVIDAFMKKQKA